MKRLLFVALALCCLVGVANAQTTALSAPRWQTGITLNFRSTIQANVTAGTTSDTAYATGSAAKSDTSVAFPLSNVYLPPLVPLASDSLIFMIVRVDPITTTGITLMADSACFLLPQVSMDQKTWISMTAPGISEGSTYHISGANKLGFNSGLPTAGTNGFFFPIWQNYLATGFPSYSTTLATAPRCTQWIGWRFVRFIVGSASTWKHNISIDYLTLK